jgi:diguanylate cyclase (GGDEF)-like protein
LQEQPHVNNVGVDESQQPHVVSLFSLVGMSITAIMGLIGLFNKDFILATALFISSFIYFIGYYISNKFNNLVLSSAIVLYSLYLLMFYLIFTGGVENTGPLWIFIVAPVSLFIHGLKGGLINIALFVTIISIIMFLPTDNFSQAEYTLSFKFRLLSSFLTVTFLSALYEHSRDRAYKNTLELSNKYQQLAHFDPLTQLSNRRDALHTLQREQARIVRNTEPLTVILCDVDHFKKINDQYGHNAGDAVLIELAKIFKASIREQDCIARWGGEEFLFILPGTLAINANIFAEKIQAILQKNLVRFESETIKVTVSMGIEQFSENQNIDEVIKTADMYLYQAKNAGRNQIFPKF